MTVRHCRATVTLRVIVNQDTSNIINAYKLPFHDH